MLAMKKAFTRPVFVAYVEECSNLPQWNSYHIHKRYVLLNVNPFVCWNVLGETLNIVVFFNHFSIRRWFIALKTYVTSRGRQHPVYSTGQVITCPVKCTRVDLEGAHPTPISNPFWNSLFPNFNCATVKAWDWISNSIAPYIMGVVTYPC